MQAPPSIVNRKESSAGDVVIFESQNSPEESILSVTGSNGEIFNAAEASPLQTILSTLFQKFVKQAEAKMNTSLYLRLDKDIDLSLAFRKNADPPFDRLLEAMGASSKHCAKLLIDSLMVWRKYKTDSSTVNDFNMAVLSIYPNLKPKDIEVMLRERKSLISNFILCRALIAIVSQLSKITLSNELGEKLEEMAFSQLSNSEPDLIAKSVNRQANVDFFAQLLGVLSEIRFSTVTDRFVAEIKKCTGSSKENKLELTVRYMNYIKCKIYPMEAFEETTEFIQSLAETFVICTGRPKQTFSELFMALLAPIAATATAELNVPTWMKLIELIYPKAFRMLSKPRHLHLAFPFVSAVLSVARKDFFLKNLMLFADQCLTKLRDRQFKSYAMFSLIQLTWTYLFRCAEATNLTQKNLKTILRILFPQQRRSSIIPEQCNLDNFVLILYFICIRYQEFGLEQLVNSLLGMDMRHGSSSNSPTLGHASSTASSTNTSLMSGSLYPEGAGKDFTVTNLDEEMNSSRNTPIFQGSQLTMESAEDTFVPDRFIIAIRTLSLLIADVEEIVDQDKHGMTAGTVSSFGVSSGNIIVEGRVTIPPPKYPLEDLNSGAIVGDMLSLAQFRHRNGGKLDAAYDTPMNKVLSERVAPKFSASLREAVGKANEMLGKAAIVCESTMANYLIIDTSPSAAPTSTIGRKGSFSDLPSGVGLANMNDASSTSTILASGTVSGSRWPVSGTESMKDSKDKTIINELLRVWLDCLPRFQCTGLSVRKVLESISRYCMNGEESVRVAAYAALKRVCMIRTPSAWSSIAEYGYIAGGVCKIFEDTLTAVIQERFTDVVVSFNQDGSDRLSEVGANTYLQLLDLWLDEIAENLLKQGFSTWENTDIYRIVEDIEARGLIFLCSTLPNIRKLGVKIMQQAETFELKMKGKTPEELREAPLAPIPKASASNHTAGMAEYSSCLSSKTARLIRILSECSTDVINDRFYESGTPPVGGYASSPQSSSKFIEHDRKRWQYRESLTVYATSDETFEIGLWNRCFPSVLKWFFHYASPRAIHVCMKDLGTRLSILTPPIIASSEGLSFAGSRGNASTVRWTPSLNTATASSMAEFVMRKPIAPNQIVPDDVVEQWRHYLIFAFTYVDIDRALGLDSGRKILKTGEKSDSTSGLSSNTNLPPYATSTLPKIVSSATELVSAILPVIACERLSVRQASITALGNLHHISYHELMGVFSSVIKTVIDEVRVKGSSGARDRRSTTATQLAQQRKAERLRSELPHALSAVADFVLIEKVRQHEGIMSGILSYIKETIRFLSDNDVQNEWDHHVIRYYFATFVERYYNHIFQLSSLENLERLFPFESRLSAFQLFEGWCGYGRLSVKTREREAKMTQGVLDLIRDVKERAIIMENMEDHRKALEATSLTAMSVLLKGPLVGPHSVGTKFDLKNLIEWLDSVFNSSDPVYHTVARLGLERLLETNPNNQELIVYVFTQCYVSPKDTRISNLYFTALVNVFLRSNYDQWNLPRMAFLAIFKISDSNIIVRKLSSRMLQGIYVKYWGLNPGQVTSPMFENTLIGKHLLEQERDLDENDEDVLMENQPASGMTCEAQNAGALNSHLPAFPSIFQNNQEFLAMETASITSELPAVYKYAQFAFSEKMSLEHPELATEMLSEMAMRIDMIAGNKLPGADIRGIKDILTFMVPWFSIVELEEGEEDLESSPTLAFLTNLLYLTIRYGEEHVLPMENIWLQLVSRHRLSIIDQNIPVYERHIRIFVNYLLKVGICRRNPKFVSYVKQIVVYLGRTEQCAYLVEVMLQQITPKSIMPIEEIGEEKIAPTPNDYVTSAYVADLNVVLPAMPSRPPFSRGQLASLLLVDLSIETGHVMLPHLPLVLHMIFLQLDHFMSFTSEEVRIFLINLIQALVPRESMGVDMDVVFAALSRKEGKRMWAHEDIVPDNRSIRSSSHLITFVEEVRNLFASVDPELGQNWGELALRWGTTCPVRHSASRSLQIYRALMPKFGIKALGEILHRLASTVSDSFEDIQGFALELIIAIHTMLDQMDSERLSQSPQFFWAAVPLLTSSYEWEYMEGLDILQKVLEKIDMTNNIVYQTVCTAMPYKWKSLASNIPFQGILPFLLRGLNSVKAEKKCLQLINDVSLWSDGGLIDPDPKSRVLFTVLANMARLLQGFEQPLDSDQAKYAFLTLSECCESAQKISQIAFKHSLFALSKLFESYTKRRFRSKDDFMRQFVSVIVENFFPHYQDQCMTFLLGILSNPWLFYRKRILYCLKSILQVMSSRKIRLGEGNDLGGRAPSNTSLDKGNLLEVVPGWQSAANLAPLLALLQTDLYYEASEIIEEILPLNVSGSESNLGLVFGGKSIYKIVREPIVDDGVLLKDRTGWRGGDALVLEKLTKYNMEKVAISCRESAVSNKDLGMESKALIKKPAVSSSSILEKFDSSASILFSQRSPTDGQANKLANILTSDKPPSMLQHGKSNDSYDAVDDDYWGQDILKKLRELEEYFADPAKQSPSPENEKVKPKPDAKISEDEIMADTKTLPQSLPVTPPAQRLLSVTESADVSSSHPKSTITAMFSEKPVLNSQPLIPPEVKPRVMKDTRSEPQIVDSALLAVPKSSQASFRGHKKSHSRSQPQVLKDFSPASLKDTVKGSMLEKPRLESMFESPNSQLNSVVDLSAPKAKEPYASHSPLRQAIVNAEIYDNSLLRHIFEQLDLCFELTFRLVTPYIETKMEGYWNLLSQFISTTLHLDMERARKNGAMSSAVSVEKCSSDAKGHGTFVTVRMNVGRVTGTEVAQKIRNIQNALYLEELGRWLTKQGSTVETNSSQAFQFDGTWVPIIKVSYSGVDIPYESGCLASVFSGTDVSKQKLRTLIGERGLKVDKLDDGGSDDDDDDVADFLAVKEEVRILQSSRELVALVHSDWTSCTKSLPDAKDASLKSLSESMSEIKLKYSLDFLSHPEARFYVAARESLESLSTKKLDSFHLKRANNQAEMNDLFARYIKQREKHRAEWTESELLELSQVFLQLYLTLMELWGVYERYGVGQFDAGTEDDESEGRPSSGRALVQRVLDEFFPSSSVSSSSSSSLDGAVDGPRKGSE